jgi:hypothetical protein
MFGLLCMGRSAYEDIATFRKDELFRSAFGLEYVPARETLRIYLGRMARKVKDLIAMLSSCNVTLLKRAAITPIDIEGRRYIPVDVDVSTFDNGKSHKEGVGRTYMGTDGYAPIFSYIGTEGYMLDCELKSRHAAQPEGDTRFSVPEPPDGQGAGTVASGPVPAGLGQRRHRYDQETRSAGLFFPDQAESPPGITRTVAGNR